jgi:hypothetical protein
MISRAAASLVLLAASTSPALAATAVVPANLATEEGEWAYGLTSELTGQQLFPASALTMLPVGAQITGMQFRLDGSSTSSPASNIANFDVFLEPTTLTTLSPTFAANHGPDVVQTRSGALSFASGSYPNGGLPRSFGPVIPFSTAFTYAGGSILLTMSYSSPSGWLIWDFSNSTAGAYWVQGDGYNQATANSASPNNTLITQFTYVVPEPVNLAGAAGFALLVRRRRSIGAALPDKTARTNKKDERGAVRRVRWV